MGIITHILKQTATVITTEYNVYGDQQLVSSETYPCRFRYITDLDRNINRDELNGDALVWFESDVPITEGDIINVDDKYWRIMRLTKARALEGETIEFLKALVDRHELAA